MIEMFTAYTHEMDDLDLALEEILEQLNLPENMRKHTVGILCCHSDCIETGLVEHLGRSLPFPVVGGTTLGGATGGQSSMMMLSLAVLTSDAVEFCTVSTPSLRQMDMEAAFEIAWQEGASTLGGTPAMAIAFFPLFTDLGGEQMLETLDKVAKGTPLFGTIVSDHFSDYRTANTFFNDSISREAVSMILIKGDIQPRFFIAAISDEHVQKQKAVITESEGSVLKRVNGMPTEEYMKTLGLAGNEASQSLSAIRFMVDMGDGTKPIARAIYMLTPEGYAVCGGKMPTGSTLAIGSLDREGVITTAQEMMDEIFDKGTPNGLLLFPCLSREMVLGMDVLAELEYLSEQLGDKIPYIVSYAGGEICPVEAEGGSLQNRFHNYTLIGCAF